MSSTKNTLLVIPNTDVDVLQSIIKNYTEPRPLETIEHSHFTKSLPADTSLESLGVYLCDPAQRLISAYRVTVKRNRNHVGTFEDFYSKPQRTNFYSRLLKDVDFSSIGFIGLREHLHKSILMAADWLNSTLYRVPYGGNVTQAPQEDLPQKDLDKIKMLYAEDYKLYEKAKSNFDKRWSAYKTKYAPAIGNGKKLKIHLGPPKTGTSAIQSWLHENREPLNAEGIYYPKHNTDDNGVSSGNFERFVTIERGDKLPYFSDEKASNLIEEFNASQCNTLLLSSEHFFYYLIWLFSRFQTAEFIFYIRHPIALAESGFHQEVKRHGRVKPFSLPQNVSFQNLNIVKSLASEFDCKVTYRYYDKKQFVSGNLISDFLHTIGSHITAPKIAKKLNTQYSPGAIKLMLECNSFASTSLLRELDLFLQRYSEGIGAFSFISNKDFEESQIKLKKLASELSDKEETLNANAICALVDNYKKPKTCSDNSVDSDLRNLLTVMSDRSPALYRTLYRELSTAENSDLIKLINLRWYTKVWYKVLGRKRGRS